MAGFDVAQSQDFAYSQGNLGVRAAPDVRQAMPEFLIVGFVGAAASKQGRVK